MIDYLIVWQWEKEAYERGGEEQKNALVRVATSNRTVEFK